MIFRTRLIARRAPRHTGFSLLELMVTIGIVMLVTGVSLVRYGSFNNSVLLKSQAYELALDIREAQLFGVSVSGANAGEFQGAYGIYFDLSQSNVYQLFQDSSNGNDSYDDGEAVGDSFTIDPRFLITGIETDQGCSPTEVSIAFRRPNFDALMWTDASGCSNPNQVTIRLAAAADSTVTREVIVYQSGLIEVN